MFHYAYVTEKKTHLRYPLQEQPLLTLHMSRQGSPEGPSKFVVI